MVWYSQVPLCQLWSWQLSWDQLVGSVSHWSSPEELKSSSQCLSFWILKQYRCCSFQEFESLHLLTFMSCIMCKNSFQHSFCAKIGIDIDSSERNSWKSYRMQELHTVVFISCVNFFYLNFFFKSAVIYKSSARLVYPVVQNQIFTHKNELFRYILLILGLIYFYRYIDFNIYKFFLFIFL